MTTAERLQPAAQGEVVKALSSALVLVAPAGFSEGDRRAWLTVAAGTLQGIPPDLLARGVAEARKVADHPSKIVPAIIAEVGRSWDKRKDELWQDRAAPEPLPSASSEPCRPEEAARIMAEFGLDQASQNPRPKHVGPPRQPTRQDYLDLGVPAETLDRLEGERR